MDIDYGYCQCGSRLVYSLNAGVALGLLRHTVTHTQLVCFWYRGPDLGVVARLHNPRPFPQAKRDLSPLMYYAVQPASH